MNGHYDLGCEECKCFKNQDNDKNIYRTGFCNIDMHEVGKTEKICKDFEPKGGLTAWLPDEYIRCQITGDTYKCDDWYLAMGESIHKLSEITLKILELIKENE